MPFFNPSLYDLILGGGIGATGIGGSPSPTLPAGPGPSSVPGGPPPGLTPVRGVGNAAAGTAPKTGLAGFSERLGEALGNPVTQLGLNVLANSGPSAVPRSFGQIVGQAGLQTLQQQNQNKLLEAQQRLLEARTSAVSSTPPNQNVQSQFITKDGKLGFLRRDGSTEVTDIDVEERFTIRKLPDGTEIAVSNTDPSEIVPVVTEDEAVAAAERRGETERRVEAQGELPQLEATTERQLDLLDQMKSHPGKAGAVGLRGAGTGFGLFDEQGIAGTPAADFIALSEQVGGASFLQAFQELKGGGHITEIEGQKAERAISRLGNRNQSEKSYDQAIDELSEILRSGLQRKRQAAGQESPQAPQATKRYNPETGRIEDI